MSATNPAATLRTKADGLQKKIDHCFRERLTNTRKRANEDESMRREGSTLQAVQEVLRKLAECHDAGNTPAILEKLRCISDAETPVRRVKYAERYAAEFPHSDRPVELTALEQAIRALLAPVEPSAEKLHRLERDIKLHDIPGFFPTKAPAVARLIGLAELTPDMSVLEPSAGCGAIADAARAAGCPVDVVEINDGLREILRLKGHTLLPERDFLDLDPANGLYDRVLMNPPFENFQDIDHVVHAYTLLKPGGVLVAITSPAWERRDSRKAEEFRAWFGGIGGTVDNLPSGSFEKTGCPGKLLAIRKPAGKLTMIPRDFAVDAADDGEVAGRAARHSGSASHAPVCPTQALRAAGPVQGNLFA